MRNVFVVESMPSAPGLSERACASICGIDAKIGGAGCVRVQLLAAQAPGSARKAK